MATFAGVYRARAMQINGSSLVAYVPQVFGETQITITTFVGNPPPAPGMGWVLFQGGNPEFPVWMGVSVGGDGGGGGEGDDEVWIGPSDPGAEYELWVDTTPVPPPPIVGGVGYLHIQSTPAATWVVVHNLGFYPNVIVEDSAGTTVEGEIVFNSLTQLTLTFSAAFSGVAYLS